MTDLSIDIDVVTFPKADDDVDHWTCCKNEDISLCGKDMSEAALKDFHLSGCDFCDHHVYTEYCPLGLICPPPTYEEMPNEVNEASEGSPGSPGT